MQHWQHCSLCVYGEFMVFFVCFRSSKTRSGLRSTPLDGALTVDMETEGQQHLLSRRTSQRLAKQPSIEELEPIPLDPIRADSLEQETNFPDDSKIVRACGGSQRSSVKGDMTDDDEDEEEHGDPIVSRQRYVSSSNKGRSNSGTHRSKITSSNHVTKNNNLIKEEDLEKRFEEKKFEDLQRKLSDSIRNRDETAAAITILPTDLRPVIEANGSLDVLEQQQLQQRIHSTIDYRLEDNQQGSLSPNCGTIIAQSDKITCDFNNHSGESLLHDSKARVKLKPDDMCDEEMHVLSNGLEPMDTYMPLVGDLSQLEDDPPKKVFLSDSNDSTDTMLCNGQDIDDKRRKRDDKKDDKNKKKKLKPLEEENLSK